MAWKVENVLIEHAVGIKGARRTSSSAEQLRHAKAELAHLAVIGLHGLLERRELRLVREDVGPVQRILHLLTVQIHMATDVVAFLGVACWKPELATAAQPRERQASVIHALGLHCWIQRLFVHERIPAHVLVSQHLALLLGRLVEERGHLAVHLRQELRCDTVVHEIEEAHSSACLWKKGDQQSVNEMVVVV